MRLGAPHPTLPPSREPIRDQQVSGRPIIRRFGDDDRADAALTITLIDVIDYVKRRNAYFAIQSALRSIVLYYSEYFPARSLGLAPRGGRGCAAHVHANTSNL